MITLKIILENVIMREIEVQQMYALLRKTQEPKGYFFNKDKDKVFDLLSALIEKTGAVWIRVVSVPVGCRRFGMGSGHYLPLCLS